MFFSWLRTHYHWLTPVLLFALVAPFTPYWDLCTARYFYSETAHAFPNPSFFHGLFVYGEWFGIGTGLLAFGVWMASLLTPRYKKYRRAARTAFLTLLIGAGVITNALFKEYWGRPRPRQIVECGGNHPYRPFWRPNFSQNGDPQKSFPSGHAAMGFYFFSIILLGKRYKSRVLLHTGLFLTLLLGGGLMIGRVVQGGHFVSDVLASAVLMWLVALFIDALGHRNKEGAEVPPPKKRIS